MKLLNQSLFALLLPFCLLNTQCEDDDAVFMTASGCDNFVIETDEGYNAESPVEFTILNAEIIDNCLVIEFSGVACDTYAKELVVYASTSIAESFPVQRSLKAHFSNSGMCTTEFEKIMSFDLLDLKLANENAIIFNLEGWDASLLYEY